MSRVTRTPKRGRGEVDGGEDTYPLAKGMKTNQQQLRRQAMDNNRFGLLSDDAEERENIDRVLPTRFPPIIIGQEQVNIKDTHQKIKGWVKKVHFKTNSSKEQQIYTYTKEDYVTVKQKLSAAGINFYTFTPADEKKYRVVLKGIDSDYDVADIKDDLITQCKDIVDVKQMKSIRNGTDAFLPLYEVTVKSLTKYSTLKKSIFYCCDHRVTLEPYRKLSKLWSRIVQLFDALSLCEMF